MEHAFGPPHHSVTTSSRSIDGGHREGLVIARLHADIPIRGPVRWLGNQALELGFEVLDGQLGHVIFR